MPALADATKIDPGEHIGLLHYVIAHLNIPAHLADEALSEGYVALTKAALTYKADKKVPEGAWIRRYIQWELTTWQQREYKNNTSEIAESYPTPDLSVLSSVEDRFKLSEVIVAAEQLTDQERVALIGEEVYDMTRIQTSKMLHMYGPDVDRLKAQARAKLANIIKQQRIMKGLITEGPTKEKQIMATATAKGNKKVEEPQAPAKPERVWCTGTTKSGAECSMPVIIGYKACFNHMPQKYKDAHPRVRKEKPAKAESDVIDLADAEILELDEDGNEVIEEAEEDEVEEPVVAKATPPRRAAPAAPTPAPRTVARASNAAPLPTKAKTRAK